MSSIGSGKKRAEEAPDEHKRPAGKPSDVGRIASIWNVQLAFYDSRLCLEIALSQVDFIYFSSFIYSIQRNSQNLRVMNRCLNLSSNTNITCYLD